MIGTAQFDYANLIDFHNDNVSIFELSIYFDNRVLALYIDVCI